MTDSEGQKGKDDDIHVNSAVRQGFIWNMLNFLFSQGAGVVIFIVLAGAVTPAMFGVFALAAIIVDLFTLQGRWAAMDALIQRQDFSSRVLSTAFFSLTGVALLVLLASWIGAGQLALAFEEPSLTAILPTLALTLVFTPPIIVMDALIMRRLRFRAQAIRAIIGTLVGGAAGIAVALSPAVEWALVAQRLASTLVTAGFLFAVTRWAPTFEFNRADAQDFLFRAAKLWSTSVLASAHARIVEAFVGFRTGAESVGFITVARRFETLLHGPVTGPIQGQWIPVLSMLRDDKAESWRLFLRLSQLTALIAVPAFVGLGLVAEELIALVLQPAYSHAGPVLMVIGLQGVFVPAGFFANLIFAGLNRTGLSLRFSLANLAVCIPVVWIASGYGAVPALASAALVMGTGGVIATLMQIRLFGGSVRQFAAALAPGYSGVAAMAVAVLALKIVLPAEPVLLRLIALVAVGAAVYAGWVFMLHRQQLMEAWRYISQSRAKATAAT